MMNKTVIYLVGATLMLTGCQTAQPFNGQIGYEVQQQDASGVILQYTLASQSTQNMINIRIQQACRHVLKASYTGQWTLLSQHTIANTATTMHEGVNLNNTRTQFALSNTPRLHNTEDYASKQVLTAPPSTLAVLRVHCQSTNTQ